MPTLSIIIVTHNREELLNKLLKEIFAQTQEAEVLVVNNSPKELILNGYDIDLIWKQHPTPGEARNTALKKASGEWILFLDDDVLIPENYFDRTLSFLKTDHQNYDIIGGPDQTPPESSLFSTCLGLCLSSPMTTATTRHRHSLLDKQMVAGDEKNLILCNLWVKKSFLDQHGLEFNGDFFRNEENILISEALKLRARALYRSNFYVYHHRKSHIKDLMRSTYSSGKYRAKSFFFSRNLFNVLFLVPVGWIIYLFILFYLLKLSSYFIIPAYLYVILSIYFSLRAARGSLIKTPIILSYQITMNLAYALGMINGLILYGLNVRRRL